MLIKFSIYLLVSGTLYHNELLIRKRESREAPDIVIKHDFYYYFIIKLFLSQIYIVYIYDMFDLDYL